MPIIGASVTFALAVKFSGKRRFIVLWAAPIATLLLCFIFGKSIAEGGNLLFAVLFGLYLSAVCLYYPILIGFIIAQYYKAKKNG